MEMLEFRGEVGTAVIDLRVSNMDEIVKDPGVSAPKEKTSQH